MDLKQFNRAGEIVKEVEAISKNKKSITNAKTCLSTDIENNKIYTTITISSKTNRDFNIVCKSLDLILFLQSQESKSNHNIKMLEKEFKNL